jgi:archaellum component FlaC
MSISAEEAQRSIEKAAMEVTQAHFETAVEKERQAYLDNVNKFKEGYAQITTEAIGEFNTQIGNKQKELADISIELEGLSKKVDAA